MFSLVLRAAASLQWSHDFELGILKQNIVLGGDFNMVEDLFLDRLGGNPNNTYMLDLDSLTEIKQTKNFDRYMEKRNLI